MLLLLIKTLTNAPNNSSVRTVSERSGSEDSYPPTDRHTQTFESSDRLNFPGAKLRPPGAQGRIKQALQRRLKSC